MTLAYEKLVGAIEDAIQEFQKNLPGWWFTVGLCSVSRDASCAPDSEGPDAGLLKYRQFDEGFHADLSGPYTIADALRAVMAHALEAKQAINETIDEKVEVIEIGEPKLMHAIWQGPDLINLNVKDLLYAIGEYQIMSDGRLFIHNSITVEIGDVLIKFNDGKVLTMSVAQWRTLITYCS